MNRKIVTVDSMEDTLPESIKYTPSSDMAKQIKDEITKRDLAPGTTLSTHYNGAWSERPSSREDITVQWIGGTEQPSGMLSGDVWFKELEGPDNTPPSVPTGLMAYETTTTGFSLSWNGSLDRSGVSGYEVFVGGVLKAATSNEFYTVTGLNAGTTYTVKVRASDVVGNLSDFSEEIQVQTDEPVMGEFHSIFGNDDPPATLSFHNDGNPSIISSTGFYTTGDSAGWSCVGARQYIPVGSEAIGKTITLGLYSGGQPVDDSFGPDLSGDSLKSATTTAVAGWNEVIWETPYTLETGLPAVYVSTTFGTNEYLVGSLQQKDSSIPSPTSGNRLHMSESSAQVVRSAFMIAGNPTKRSTDGFWYGQDILVSESGA